MYGYDAMGTQNDLWRGVLYIRFVSFIAIIAMNETILVYRGGSKRSFCVPIASYM
jgi:hypothetical protein